MRCTIRIEAGFSFLESALAIPPLILLLLIAIDATNFLRTYSVLREVVTTVTHYAATVDARSNQVSADTQVRLYDWYAYTQNGNNLSKNLVATGLPDGMIPGPCQMPPPTVKCSAFFSGMGPGTPAQYAIDLNEALQQGFGELNAGIPNNKINCMGSFCSTVTAELKDLSGAGLSTHVFSLATIELPMLVLLNHPLIVRASSTERLENDLLDNAALNFNNSPIPGDPGD